MASASLQSASSYLNNLLLARGLLQDGKPVDFAHPSSSGDLDFTMSRIINLVHDLVLRRDRESEQRETLAASIRNLRAEESQRLIDFQRSQDKNGELARDLAAAEAQQRALSLALKKSEAQGKELKDQTLKMKSTLDQIRAKCLSDVRKRDAELEKLKGHLANMQRGKREASGMKIITMNPQAHGGRDKRNLPDTSNLDWSLEKETNDFLAALVNETSTENVTLRRIVSETMGTLRELTGLNEKSGTDDIEDGIGIPGQYRNSRKPKVGDSQDSIIPCDMLAEQMGTILNHCQSILKDPSFVPIEEVHIREEEIVKLRIGWEKMASRWKEAVTMMDAWRRRMLDRDEKIDVDELSNLDFGRSVALLPNGQPVLGQDDELSSIFSDHGVVSEREASDSKDNQDSAELEESAESELDIPPEPIPKRIASSPARRGIKLPQSSRALREINGNGKADKSKPGAPFLKADADFEDLGGTIHENDASRANSRSKIPRQQIPNTPPLSVAEKLAAVEAEAKAAENALRQEVGHKRKAKPIMATKGSRRRSTLSPDELAALMGVR